MQITVYEKCTTFDRKTGRKLGSKIVGAREVNEAAHYAPLLEMLSADPKFQELRHTKEKAASAKATDS